MRRPALAIAVVAALGTGLAAWRPTMPGLPGPRPVPIRRTSLERPRPPPRQAAHAAAIVLARPLWSASRRPGQAEPAAATPRHGQPAPRLTGTLIAGGRRVAIFAAQGQASAAREQGGAIGGFAVARVDPGTVTLIGPAGRLTFSVGGGVGGPAALALAAPIAASSPRQAIRTEDGQHEE
jgi:hypothetical protein